MEEEREDLARVYTHVAGLSHFFMDRRLPRVDDEIGAADRTNASGGNAWSAAEKRLDEFNADDSRAAFFSALIAVYRGAAPPEKLWQLAGNENAQQDYVHFQLVAIDMLNRSNRPNYAQTRLVSWCSRAVA